VPRAALLLLAAMVMAIATLGMRDGAPPGFAALGTAAMAMITVLILSEDSLQLAPRAPPRRQALAVGLMLSALALGFLPVPPDVLLMTLAVAMLAAQWLAPLPSPRWIEGLANAGPITRHVPDAAPLLRLIALMILWLACALVEDNATVFKAGAAMPLVRSLWILGCALPDAWSRRRARDTAA
jgi:hypothetical protein